MRRFPRGTEFKVLQPVDVNVDDDGVLGKASKKSPRVLQPVDDDDVDVEMVRASSAGTVATACAPVGRRERTRLMRPSSWKH